MGFLHWHGELGKATRKQRINVALFLVLLEVSAIFTDFSHVYVSKEIYLSLLLPPLALAGLLLGPIGGAFVGLATGIAQYVHASFMPLHFFEIFCITPLSSIGLLSACGLLWGILFHWMLHREATLRSRLLPLCLSCLLMSLLYTLGYLHPVLSANPEAPIAALSGASLGDLMPASSLAPDKVAPIAGAQVLVNAVYVGLVCVLIHLVARRLIGFTRDIGLRSAFRLFFIFVFFITYLLTITTSYVNVSSEEMREAEAAMRSDMDYLCEQFNYLEERSHIFIDFMINTLKQSEGSLSYTKEQKQQLSTLLDSYGILLAGYSMENEGTIFLVDTYGYIGFTDDPRLPAVTTVNMDNAPNGFEYLGSDIQKAIYRSAASDKAVRILYHNILSADGATDDYDHRVQLGSLLARKVKDDTYLVIIEPSSMIFRDRWHFIGREVFLAVVLLGSTLAVIALLTDAMVTRRIKKTNEALARITAGDLEARATVEGARELKSLSTDINTTVDTLNRWIREAETRMDSELAAARAIQESSLPRSFPPFPEQTSFDIYASMHAAREVGGDFYDFFLVEGKGTDGGDLLVFLIADVSGKGVPASLFMMKTKTLIRESIMRHVEEGGDTVFETVNKVLASDNGAFMFVTLWAAMLDCVTGDLYYINAGHNPPLLCHDGEWVSLRDRSGIPLGMRPNVTYELFSCSLQPGDRLVTYTDGVTEARSEDRELFGDERLLATVEQCDATEPRELVDTVNASVSEFAGSAAQADDITVLALTYYG